MHFAVFTFFGILLFLSWCPVSPQDCTEFECPSTLTCISRKWVCDYYYDCSDKMDEDDTEQCPFPLANMLTAVIYSVNGGGSSHFVNLFGDPDQYGPMFGKPLLANSLPIRYTGRLGYTDNTFGPITVDYQRQIVYYGNNNQGLIQYGHLLYNNVTGLNSYSALRVTKQINSLAFDWVAKNLYWIDGEKKSISVLRDDGTIRPPSKVLIGNLSSPKYVAVCLPTNTTLCEECGSDGNCTCTNQTRPPYLFWSDGYGANAKIERSDLNGNNRTVLVNSTQGLLVPPTLAVDCTSRILYWLDAAASILGSVNFDGSNVTTWNRTVFSGFSTMTIHKNKILFGDKSRSRVHVYSKTSVETFGYKEFARASGPITHMTMFAADSQPTSQMTVSADPCTLDNRKCAQLCFATSPCTKVCDCTDGLVLSADGLNCEISPFDTSNKQLFLSDFNQWNIYQLLPDTGEIRIVAMKSFPIALTVDTTLNILYFIFKDDGDKKYRIRRRSFDGKIDESIFTASTAISRLAGLAMDSTRGLLYYTDSYLGIVGELSTNGAQSRIIFNNIADFPRAIVVDSRNSSLYWTDCSPSPSIQTSRVDGTDRRTLINGTMGRCFTGLAVDFIKKVMFFSSSTIVETSSLNGSNRTTLYTIHGADISAITIMDDSLIIADRNQSIPVKYNFTSRTLVAMQLPPSSSIFNNISDVKLVDFNPGVPYYGRIVIANLKFDSRYSNQSTPEYQTLFSRINPLLVSVYAKTLGAIFVYIDDIRFANDSSSVIVYNDIQLTSLPSDQMVNRTLAGILDGLTADSLLVTVVNMSSVPFPMPCFCSISIASMTFISQLSNQSTTEYQTLCNRIRTLLTSILRRTLGTAFVGIVDIRFRNGSVIAFVDIQVTRLPSDQTINATRMAVIDGMAADSLLVTNVVMSPSRIDDVTVLDTTTVTTATATSTTTTTKQSSHGPDQTIIIIIGVVVGVGGFVIVIVVLIVCCVFFLIQKKKEKDERKRSLEDSSHSGSDGVYQDIGYSEIGLVDFGEPPSSTIIDGAAAANYEPLRKQAGDTLKLPFAPEPPASRKTLADCNPYLLSSDAPLTGSTTTLNQGAPDYLHVNSLARPQNHYIDKDSGAVDGEVQTGRPQNNYVVNNREDGANYIHITPSNPYAQIESSPSCQPRRIVSANVRESILPEPDDHLGIVISHPYAQIESSKQQASRASSANSMDPDKEDYLNIAGSNPYAQIGSSALPNQQSERVAHASIADSK